MYTEIKHDRKLKRVPPGQRWLWIVIMTIASESPDPGWLLLSHGVPVTVEELADEATLPVEDAVSGIQVFIKLRMLEYVDGVYHLVNWP